MDGSVEMMLLTANKGKLRREGVVDEGASTANHIGKWDRCQACLCDASKMAKER